MPRPWTRSKKLRWACGENPRAARTLHTLRGLVPRRDAGGSKEQADLPLGQEKLTLPCAHDQRTQSTYLFGAVCPERGAGAALVLPACNTEAMQLHLDESQPKSLRALTLFSSWIKPGGTLKVPDNISLLQLPPRAPELNGQEKYLAIHAAELVVKPNLQIL